MKDTVRVFWVAAALVAGLAAGCGGSDMVTVSGQVTWDGQPLPDGDIMFQPVESKFGPDAGKIKDGKYQIQARPGSRKVEIRASRVVPGKKGPMGEDAVEDYIPAHYNDNTILKVDIKPPGKNEVNFDLKSK